jgi:hypothetical protein
LSIGVLLSVGREPTPQAYFEGGALFYNALTPTPRVFVPGEEASIPQSAPPRETSTGIELPPALDSVRGARFITASNALEDNLQSKLDLAGAAGLT